VARVFALARLLRSASHHPSLDFCRAYSLPPRILLLDPSTFPFPATIRSPILPAKAAPYSISTQLTPQPRRVCPSEKVSGPYQFAPLTRSTKRSHFIFEKGSGKLVEAKLGVKPADE
jgi:hypothetical protein